MSLDLRKILESKRALRRDLAARPIAEKLRMLDAMREFDEANNALANEDTAGQLANKEAQ